MAFKRSSLHKFHVTNNLSILLINQIRCQNTISEHLLSGDQNFCKIPIQRTDSQLSLLMAIVHIFDLSMLTELKVAYCLSNYSFYISMIFFPLFIFGAIKIDDSTLHARIQYASRPQIIQKDESRFITNSLFRSTRLFQNRVTHALCYTKLYHKHSIPQRYRRDFPKTFLQLVR